MTLKKGLFSSLLLSCLLVTNAQAITINANGFEFGMSEPITLGLFVLTTLGLFERKKIPTEQGT